MDESTKELLKILNGKKSKLESTLKPDELPPKKPQFYSIERQKKVHNFLNENKIESGRYYYYDYVMYEFFLHWCRHRVVKVYPLSFTKFVFMMKIFVKHKKLNKKLRFAININLRNDWLSPQRSAAITRWKKNEEKKKKAYEKAQYKKNKKKKEATDKAK